MAWTLPAAAQSCGVGETAVAFGFTGGEQTTVVPAGVQSATVYLSGAQGGAGRSGAGTVGGSPLSPGGTGGLGGRVRGTLAVTPGATLSVWVGGQGSQAVNAGGSGQGVDGIGGGATDLRVGGNAIGNRVAVAGGGGGGGNAGWSTTNVIAGGAGGAGGGGVGSAGATVPGGPGPFGGGGGSVGVGGAGGGGCGSFPATAGNAANGDGGDSFNFSGSFSGAGFGGGGGGGATVGGGGGGAGVGTTACQQNWNGGGGGGAGGASSAAGLTAVTLTNGVQAGNGAALVCFAAATHAVGGTASGVRGNVTLQLNATNPASTQQVVVPQNATTFQFPTRLPGGANWSVGVLSTPPGQSCGVTPTTGSAISADVTGLVLTCLSTPGAPVIGLATAGDAQASVQFTAPADTGGAAITGYTVTSAPGNLTASGPGSPIVVPGLVNGTAYTFTVTATNSVGVGAPSGPSNSVTPQGAQAISGFMATPSAPDFVPGGTFAVSATGGGSGQPVVFGTLTPAVCTVSGSTVTMQSAGPCTLTADQAGDAAHLPAPQVTLAVSIAQAAQAITGFAANPVAPQFTPNGTFTVSATGGASGNPVAFASASPAVCTVSGSTVTLLAAGTCALTANQAGDANYTAAPQVTLDVAIGRGQQAISGFAATPASPVFVPNATFSLAAVGGASGNPVVIASTTPAVCTVSGTTATMLSAGTCGLTADQAGNANYDPAPQATLAVVIGPAAQAITNFAANPGHPSYVPNGTFSVSATPGPSQSPLVFGSLSPAVCTVSGNTVSMVSAGVCALTADQAGDGNYSASPQATLDVTIGLGAQLITQFAAHPAQPVFVPNGTFTVSATGGGSTSPVVFGSASPAVCTVAAGTVTMLATGTCALTANQAGDANHAAAPQATLDVAIGAATQQIVGFAATPATPVYAHLGTFDVTATGGASASPVVFGSKTPAVCTVSGHTVTMLAAGRCTLTADQASDGNYAAAPQVTLDVDIGTATQQISDFVANPTAPVYAPQGTFTVSAAGGASSSPVVFATTTPDTCSVSGATVTMLAAGTCSLTANQAADANHAAAAQVTLDVEIGAATPVLEWVESIDKILGEAAFDLVDPTSTSAGEFTFTSSDPQVATVSGRTVTLVGAGTSTLTATQAATGNYTSASITTTLTVTARPDPTQDPGVVAGVQAQVDASVRFASTQQANIRDRLRQLRTTNGRTPSGSDLSVSVASGGQGGGLSMPLKAADSDAAMARSAPAGWGLWAAGMLSVGERDGGGAADSFDFDTDGVTVGLDRRVGADAVFGVAAGAGWNDTEYAGDRSGLDARHRALSLYGQWRDADGGFYADGVLGWGSLDFDLTRWSDPAAATATAQRDGDQWFASLNLGYEQRSHEGSLAGYGRLDASHTALDAYRETGLGIYDLSYDAQNVYNSTVAVGAEGSRVFAFRTVALRPFWSVEYREALGNSTRVGINYVVAPSASDYLLRLDSYNDGLWAVGAGMDFDFSRGWQLSLQYRFEKSADVQADSVGLRLSWQWQPGGMAVGEAAGTTSAAEAATGSTP